MYALHFQFHLSNLFPLIYTKIWKLEIYTGNKLSKKEMFQGNGNWIVEALNKKKINVYFVFSFISLFDKLCFIACGQCSSKLLFLALFVLSVLLQPGNYLCYLNVSRLFITNGLQREYKHIILFFTSISLFFFTHFLLLYVFLPFPQSPSFSFSFPLSLFLSFLSSFSLFFQLLLPNLVSILHSLFSSHSFSLCSFAFLSLLFSTLSLLHFLTSIFSFRSLLHFFPLLSYTFVFLAHLSNFVKKKTLTLNWLISLSQCLIM